MSVILPCRGQNLELQSAKVFGGLHRCFSRGTIDQKGNCLREKLLLFAIRYSPLRSFRRQVW